MHKSRIMKKKDCKPFKRLKEKKNKTTTTSVGGWRGRGIWSIPLQRPAVCEQQVWGAGKSRKLWGEASPSGSNSRSYHCHQDCQIHFKLLPSKRIVRDKNNNYLTDDSWLFPKAPRTPPLRELTVEVGSTPWESPSCYLPEASTSSLIRVAGHLTPSSQ